MLLGFSEDKITLDDVEKTGSYVITIAEVERVDRFFKKLDETNYTEKIHVGNIVTVLGRNAPIYLEPKRDINKELDELFDSLLAFIGKV